MVSLFPPQFGAVVTWPRFAVVALSLVSGSGWVLTQLYPSDIPFSFAACIHFLMIGLSGMAIWFWTGRRSLSWRVAGMIAAFGIAIFALPGIVLHFAAGAVPESAGVVIFCSIPLATVLMMTAAPDGVGGTDGRLAACVLGLGGALLLLSFDYPRSPRAWGYLLLVATSSIVVAAAGVGLRSKMQDLPLAAAVGLAGLSCAVLFAVVGTSSGWPSVTGRALAFECVRCAGVDLPLVWLVVWLMREVEPDRLATRFLLAPLFTAIEGYAGMGGGIDLRSIVAMGMMAAGAAWMLFHHDAEDVTALHLQ